MPEKERCFDALVDFSPGKESCAFKAYVQADRKAVPAVVDFYEDEEKGKGNGFFVRVCPGMALHLKWKDEFKVRKEKRGLLIGKGLVLNPGSLRVSGKKVKKRIAFLKHLLGGEKEMLLALAEENSIKGLREQEILQFCRLSISSIRRLSQELEEERKLRIFRFSPLFLISQRSFDYFTSRIVDCLDQYHRKHPQERGVSGERIKNRFGVDRKVLEFSLRYLEKKGQIKRTEDLVALAAFRIVLSPEEKRILQKLEEMCLRGEFRSVSLKDIQSRLHLSSRRLNLLLSLLVERKKIVQGKDGFLLHSHWLNEIVSKVRKLSKKELTVNDFKKITGLSRKYSIPLLELLDQMGVTRRKSPSRREIL